MRFDVSKAQVDRSIEGLIEQLCLYLASNPPDTKYDELHYLILHWVKRHHSIKEEK